jgi:phage N-6-adenine-methyltransferase
MLRVKGGGLQSWSTPQWLFDALNRVFKFKLDAAADETNAKCKKYYTLSQSGLLNPWSDITFFNPPWNNPGDWCRKAVYEASKRRRSVGLLPMLGMTAGWYREVRKSGHTTILSPRVAFDGPGNSPNGGAMIMCFGFDFSDGTLSFLDVSELRLGGRS